MKKLSRTTVVTTNNKLMLLCLGLVLALLAGCGAGNLADEAPELLLVDGEMRPAGWTEATHGRADLNYAVVFPDDKVNRLDITIASEQWQAMQDDLTEIFGEPGSFGRMGRPGFGPGGMDLDLTTENPIWAEATLEFGGNTWHHVGIRFKGNSSLMMGWTAENGKLPFKLDFDEFEDDYPEIDNQRFYGFKELSLSNNFSDESFLRETAVAKVFRDAGVPAARTGFYELYIDFGEGPQYFGLYTAVEVVDDTVVPTWFGSDDGNIYEGETGSASFAIEHYDILREGFQKENNDDADDWSDLEALHKALHAPERTSDPAAWRAGLEAVFNVDGFLRYLAVNTVVENWDTYGTLAHNYYLYNDPATGQINWIPWDNNMALRKYGMIAAFRGMNFPGSPPATNATAEPPRGFFGDFGVAPPLDLENISEEWPLIRFLMDDEVYHATYVDYVLETVNGPFAPERMTAVYETYHELITPSVMAEEEGYTMLLSKEEFEDSLAELIEHVNGRYEAAQTFYNEQK